MCVCVCRNFVFLRHCQHSFYVCVHMKRTRCFGVDAYKKQRWIDSYAIDSPTLPSLGKGRSSDAASLPPMRCNLRSTQTCFYQGSNRILYWRNSVRFCSFLACACRRTWPENIQRRVWPRKKNDERFQYVVSILSGNCVRAFQTVQSSLIIIYSIKFEPTDEPPPLKKIWKENGHGIRFSFRFIIF